MINNDGVQRFSAETNGKNRHFGAFDIVGLLGVSLFFASLSISALYNLSQ